MTRAIAESPASISVAAAITRSFGSIWETAKKQRAGFRFETVIINRCAIKRHERRENHLPASGHKPLFRDYCAIYFEKAKVQRKHRGTLDGERQALGRWCDHLGHVRIDRIVTPSLAAFTDKRLKRGVFAGRYLEPSSERTANLDLTRLRNVLKMAVDDGYLRELPRMKMLDEPPVPKRNFVTPAEFDQLIETARNACEKNGQQLADYLRFLAFSGAREKEALRVKWVDVDFDRGRVTIGADGLAKNREVRTVEFNPQLGTLLQEINARRAPDCSWLFPSPQRGRRDDHAKSFRESLKIAREAAGLEWVGFHDLRHYFCSVCVMAGIDFMTIAAWFGHKDGGILVGKVYGHLLDEHRSKAAKLVQFGLLVVPPALAQRVCGEYLILLSRRSALWLRRSLGKLACRRASLNRAISERAK